MPERIKTFCVNGCAGKGVHGTRLCPRCYDQREDRNAEAKQEREQMRLSHEGNASQRGYDWAWSKVSKYVRTNEPVCRQCKNALATMVDHILPLKQGGDRLALDNLQPLCGRCHASKTQADKRTYGVGVG